MYWSSILSALPGAVLLVTRIEWLGIQWLGKPRNRDRAAAAQIEIVGNDRSIAAGRLRIKPRAIECNKARAESEGFFDVVREHDHRHAQLAPQWADERVHLGARTGVERSERLVEQQNARPPGERLCNGEALLHSPGKRARIFIAMRRKADAFEQMLALCDGFTSRSAGELAKNFAGLEFIGDQHITQHGEVRKHRIALKHDTAIRSRLGRQQRAIKQNSAARRLLLPEDQAQERALAGAGRADHGKESARGNLKIDALEHDL